MAEFAIKSCHVHKNNNKNGSSIFSCFYNSNEVFESVLVFFIVKSMYSLQIKLYQSGKTYTTSKEFYGKISRLYII